MKILLTGATDYIAQRLLRVLLEGKHEVVCCLRDKNHFNSDKFKNFDIDVIEVDFLKRETPHAIPRGRLYWDSVLSFHGFYF